MRGAESDKIGQGAPEEGGCSLRKDSTVEGTNGARPGWKRRVEIKPLKQSLSPGYATIGRGGTVGGNRNREAVTDKGRTNDYEERKSQLTTARGSKSDWRQQGS